VLTNWVPTRQASDGPRHGCRTPLDGLRSGLHMTGNTVVGDGALSVTLRDQHWRYRTSPRVYAARRLRRYVAALAGHDRRRDHLPNVCSTCSTIRGTSSYSNVVRHSMWMPRPG
jgi:hypothetical protein